MSPRKSILRRMRTARSQPAIPSHVDRVGNKAAGFPRQDMPTKPSIMKGPNPASYDWTQGWRKYQSRFMNSPGGGYPAFNFTVYYLGRIRAGKVVQSLASVSNAAKHATPMLEFVLRATADALQLTSSSKMIRAVILQAAMGKYTGSGRNERAASHFRVMTCNPSDTDTSTSRPYVHISSSYIDLPRHMPFSGRLKNRLHFRFSFHIRPDALERRSRMGDYLHVSSTQNSSQGLPDLLEHILQKAVNSVKGLASADPNDAIPLLRHSIMSHLTASPLASIADFHHCYVHLDLDYGTFSEHTLFIADGTERAYSEPPFALSPTGTISHAVLRPDQAPGASIENDGTETTHFYYPLPSLSSHSVNKEEQDALKTDTFATEAIPDVEPLLNVDGLERSRVFVALGSNIGDRLEHIEEACRQIDSDPDMQILRTSALYETEPMYVEAQDWFLNGVCELSTTLQHLDLLDRLQSIEQRLGRVKIIDKGPRNIDLDILLYNNLKLRTERLTIPHALMFEREFVLRPLRDLVRASNLSDRLEKLAAASTEPMYTWIALGPGSQNAITGRPNRQTHIMSIVNVTPDSFSDGGDHTPSDIASFTSLVRTQIAAGATILDIGGQSSRPNAPDVTAEEEIARVLPAIEAIKSIPEAADVAISVDTYRAAVAEAAIKAGAHIVNDISAGQLDPDMLSTVAKLGCTYIMMHMRGTPATMMSAENCSYPDGLIPTIAKELEERVDAALAAGVRRWRILLDPGIGFSKTVEQNLLLLKKLDKLSRHEEGLRGFPWLVGSSRKSFIGKITGVEEPKQRGWGTAPTLTAAIAGGADIVRVHDAKEMQAVVKVADAMYRAT